MTTSPNAISAHLRARAAAIAETWIVSVRAALRDLDGLHRPALVDHLPEFLEGLAAWVEGDTDAARLAFEALVEGHALQRLQLGVDLPTLTREYAILRGVIIRELGSVAGEGAVESIIRVHEGMDEAVYEAVRRYSHRRDEVRDRFVGILGHDLRNPLSSITMASAQIVAESDGLDPKLFRLGSAISRSAERMARMIHDVLEFARGQLGGGVPVTLARSDLGELCKVAFDELRSAHPDREMLLELAGDLRGPFDPDRVVQLVSNLTANAIQHGRDPITVSVTEAEDRSSLVLRVNSHGPVLSTERLARLFDPLRLEAPSTSAGLGLGLYIVRQIALAHGARCSVTSDATHGTTFAVRWPRVLDDDSRW